MTVPCADPCDGWGWLGDAAVIVGVVAGVPVPDGEDGEDGEDGDGGEAGIAGCMGGVCDGAAAWYGVGVGNDPVCPGGCGGLEPVAGAVRCTCISDLPHFKHKTLPCGFSVPQ